MIFIFQNFLKKLIFSDKNNFRNNFLILQPDVCMKFFRKMFPSLSDFRSYCIFVLTKKSIINKN